MRFYLDAFVKSLYDFKWLSGQKGKMKKGFIYFTLLMVLGGLVFLVGVLTSAPKFVKEFKNTVNNELPELTLVGEDNLIHIEGLPQPYIYEAEGDDGDFIFVVDTSPEAESSLDDHIKSHHTGGVLLAADEIQVYQKDQSKTTNWDLGNFDNFNFSKGDVVSFIDKWANTVVYGFAIFGTFMVIVFGGLFKLAYLSFISFIVLVISNIADKKWKYGQIFTLGLFALTLPTVLSWALVRFWYPIPFFYTCALLFFMLMVVFYKVKKKA